MVEMTEGQRQYIDRKIEELKREYDRLLDNDYAADVARLKRELEIAKQQHERTEDRKAEIVAELEQLGHTGYPI